MIKFAEYFMVNVLELFLTRMQRELQYYNLLTCFFSFFNASGQIIPFHLIRNPYNPKLRKLIWSVLIAINSNELHSMQTLSLADGADKMN